MSLPALVCSPLAEGGIPDVLPPGGHAATLEEIQSSFVEGVNVPFVMERRKLFTVLTMYVDQVWGVWPKAELWINGGFVTLKPWAAPTDVDVAIVDTFGRLEKFKDAAASLLTLQNVHSSSLSGHAPRIQPYGGMIDGFAVPRLPASLTYWDDVWSTLCDKAGDPVPGFRKGYAKVVKPV